MILRRLYELAVREQLLDDPAFKEEAVRFVVQLDDGGNYLGIGELVGPVAGTPSSKPGRKPPPNRGMKLKVPVALGSSNARGAARYFADNLNRVLPVTFDVKEPDGAEGAAEREKRDRSRATFWAQIDQAADATDDPALRAIQAFGRRLAAPELVARLNEDCLARGAATAERCTFAWHPHHGRNLLDHEPALAWFRGHFREHSGAKQGAGPVGLCQVTAAVGPIPTTHPLRIQGVPGGLPTGVSLVSFDKDAFQSYGLEGTANAAVGYDAAEGYCRALTWLTGSTRSKIRYGDGVFLFWTREPVDDADPMALDQPNPETVQRLIESAAAGKERHDLDEDNAFYGLMLSGNAARAVVRGYLELPLREARRNLGRWFADLKIAAVEKGGAVAPTALFPLWMLATSTALKAENVAPDVYPRLLDAALGGGPLPDSVLAACLGRLRAEGGHGFRPTRLALIKLTLLRRQANVTEALNPAETNPAYVCGRLMSVFEDIQYSALGDVNASVVDKFYGTFSAAPATVFARLFANASNHLRKVKSENPKAHGPLDARLTEIAALLKQPPAGVLSLRDQGFFALGYYHQKAQRREQIAEAKARKAADA